MYIIKPTRIKCIKYVNLFNLFHKINIIVLENIRTNKNEQRI